VSGEGFGRLPAFSVGIEEELLLVSPDGTSLAPDAARVLAAAGLPGEAAGHEAYAAEVELRSAPRAGAAEAAADLRRARAAIRAAGATLMGAGVHPLAALGDAELVAEERYRRVEEEMRALIRRTPECALHVHVGMPDRETAIRVANGLRRHLPLLAALSANSPWWFGADSGMASARAAVVRAYPGRGVPRAFRDWHDYAEAVEAITRAAGVADYTYLWWDVRPHPRLGTVEVREMDAQAPLADAEALAALVRCLARLEADAGRPPSPPAEAIAWSSFRAARDGLDAGVLCEGDVVGARDAAQRTLALVAPAAAELGEDGALDGVRRILREGNGADRARAAARAGGPAGLAGHLVRGTG
jgi:carboxylate-amine ligase